MFFFVRSWSLYLFNIPVFVLFVVVFSFSLSQSSSPCLFASSWSSSCRIFDLSMSLWIFLFQPSLWLFNITFPILVVILFSLPGSSSPCPNSFAYPCCHFHSTYPCLFISLWYSSPCIFSLSISLRLYLLQLSLRLVDITSPILVAIFLFLSLLSYPYPYYLLLVIINFLILFTIVSPLLPISSPSLDSLLLFALPRRYHFAYPSRNRLLLDVIFFSLSVFYYPFPDSFSCIFRNCRRAFPRRGCLDFDLILIPLKHYQWYQKLWKRVNFKKILKIETDELLYIWHNKMKFFFQSTLTIIIKGSAFFLKIYTLLKSLSIFRFFSKNIFVWL